MATNKNLNEEAQHLRGVLFLLIGKKVTHICENQCESVLLRIQKRLKFVTVRWVQGITTIIGVLLIKTDIIRGIPRQKCTRFGGTHTKIGTIQRRLAWPLRKDDTQNREASNLFNFSIFTNPKRALELSQI